jgi:hypothetical protein
VAKIITSIITQLLKNTIRDNKVTQIMLVWTCAESGRKQNPRKVLYINLETTRLRGRPGNRWQDEVRGDGRIVGGEE